MRKNILAVRTMISLRDADKMIWTFIYHGNHRYRNDIKDSPKRPIEEWFSDNNEPLPKVIARCRRYFETLAPVVENLVHSTWTIEMVDVDMTVSINKEGKDQPEVEVSGPGTISVDYEAKFESACRARDRAIEDASFEELHTAVTKGIASIDSYLSHRAEIYNRTIGSFNPLIDQKEKKVSLEDKVKVWVPKMTGGSKLDLGGKMWADFLALQQIRHCDAIHPKKFAQGGLFSDLALMLNKFKTGLADFLLQLHILFGEPAPRVIIRARFFPEVYLSSKVR